MVRLLLCCCREGTNKQSFSTNSVYVRQSFFATAHQNLRLFGTEFSGRSDSEESSDSKRRMSDESQTRDEFDEIFNDLYVC